MKEKMVPGLPPWPLYKGSAMRWPPVLKHSTINLREGSDLLRLTDIKVLHQHGDSSEAPCRSP